MTSLPSTYTIAQTFVIDPALVKGADQVSLSSVELFFRQKPTGSENNSGVLYPGVTVFIVPTGAGGVPNYGGFIGDWPSSRKEFSEITSSTKATVATKFSFRPYAMLKTGVEYAVVFKPDYGESFKLWTYTQGELSVTTNATSPGIAGKFTGKYFELSSAAGSWQPLNYKALKFKVYVARYAIDGVIPQDFPADFTMNIKNYEYVTYDTAKSYGKFMGGELIYQDQIDSMGHRPTANTCATLAGNNIITATGGLFAGISSTPSDESYIVIRSNDKVDVRKVLKVTDGDNKAHLDQPMSFQNAAATFIRSPVAIAYVSRNGKFVSQSDNFVVLSNSTANSSMRFSNNSLLIGSVSGASLSNCYFNDIAVHVVEPHVYVHTPPASSYVATQIFSYTSNETDGTTDVLTGALAGSETSLNVSMYRPYEIESEQPVLLMSRSNEMTLRNWSANQQSKSSRIRYNITTTNDFVSPSIDKNATDVFFTKYTINNDSTDEHKNQGNAISKHISTKVAFAKGREAEDIIVYLSAYKPIYTDLRVYVKFYNNIDPDYFDDKEWTLLKETSGAAPSSLTDGSDYVEYTYGLRDYGTDGNITIPATGEDGVISDIPLMETLNGINKIIPDSQNIEGFDTDYVNDLYPGDLIKIYPSLFPEQYVVRAVKQIIDTDSLIVDEIISSTDVERLGTSFFPTTKSDVYDITANTLYINAANDVLSFTSANTKFKIGDKLYYNVPSGNTPISSLSGNTYYYVVYSNSSSIALSTEPDGSNVQITDTRNDGYAHTVAANVANPITLEVYANSSGFSNTADILKITNANSYFTVGSRVQYVTDPAETPISPFVANTFYYVSFANSSGIALSQTLGGANVDITDARNPSSAETHNIISDFIAGGVNPTTNYILLSNANTYFKQGRRVYYTVPTGNTAISGLVGNTYYYVSYADSRGFALSETLGGANIDLTEARTTSAETHYFTANAEIHSLRISTTSGEGIKIDRINFTHQAFQNKGNDNTVRYYNSSVSPIDKYDSFAIKVVFLSQNQFIVPKLADIRAVGVSA